MKKTLQRTTLAFAVFALCAMATAETRAQDSTPVANAAASTPSDALRSGPLATLHAQVLLERAWFSPGQIDGVNGSNMKKAIAGFRQSQGLSATAELDDATWAASEAKAGTTPLIDYTLTEDDVKGPFRAVPGSMAAKARVKSLGYASLLEKLGERFHASPTLLKKLNPTSDFKAGSVIRVPNVLDIVALPKAGKVLVDKSASLLLVVDAQNTVVAQFPVTTGSEHDPLPVGEWKINGVARDPEFHYNPKLFWDARKGDRKATIPPGPNNPVGRVWIDLSKPHYGIHGTPEPSTIGKTESHGCIRMTNWSVLQLAEAVGPGTPASLVE